jgi:hypothetical protein
MTSDNKRECSFTVSVRKDGEKAVCGTKEKQVHYRHHRHHYEGGLSLPRRTTNDLGGGASDPPELEPEPDPLANGWEGFRSRRTTNERPVSTGSSSSTSSPGRASSPSLCRRGLRSWNQCRFLGWLTSGESSSETGLTTSDESCDCLRNDDGPKAAS